MKRSKSLEVGDSKDADSAALLPFFPGAIRATACRTDQQLSAWGFVYVPGR
jgi:hypothetical protein